MNASLTWRSWSEIGGIVLHPQYLRRTLPTALIVGTILLLINHGDVIVHGQYTLRVGIKAGVTYCVPFVVSNIGVLIATRRRAAIDGSAEPGHPAETRPFRAANDSYREKERE